MNIYRKRESNKLLAILISIAILVTAILPLSPSLFQGNMGKAFADESFDNLAVKAVRNIYSVHQEGLAVDGGYGHFGACEAYILSQAGADVSSWVYRGSSLKAGILNLIDETISKDETANKSPAKRVAQEFLAAEAFGDNRAAQLLTILKNRQTASGNGSFDTGLYGIYSNMPAFEALGRAGDIAGFDTQKAVSYILGSQDPVTKAWPAEDIPNYITNDFMTTTQAVRTLVYLEPFAGGKTDAVRTALDGAKTWLQNRQQTDGSFRDTAGFDDPLVDTAEAILTLARLGLAPDAWTTEGKSAVDYMRNDALNEDGTFGSSGNLADDTWALDACLALGGSVHPETALGVKVTPEEAEISVGRTQQYEAHISQMNGAVNAVSSTAVWTVDNTGIAAVDNKGIVTGVAAGNTVVTAVYQGVCGTAGVTVEANGSGGGNPSSQYTAVSVKVTGKSGNTLFPNTTVYLSANDVHSVTPVGALDKTGLSYSYNSIDYIHTIAGQGPEGMNGWMYKVNEAAPAIPAIQYKLNANDQVLWYFSAYQENTSGSYEGSALIPPQDKTGDEIIREALEKNQEIKISLESRKNNMVEISPDSINKLIELNKEMTLTNKGIEIRFASNDLYTEQLKKAFSEVKGTVQLGAKNITASEKQEILAKAKIGQSTGLFDVGGNIADLTAQISKESSAGIAGTKETEIINSFNEPVKVILDLSGAALKDEDIAKLTALRYEKDAAGNIVPVRLGGSYDPSSKTFTFYTGKFSYYGIVEAEDLVTMSMGINMTATTVNGKAGYTDVAPILLNNRTMVPLRIVAESLGADVQWLEQTRTVEIKLKDKSLRLVADKTAPGMDTPVTIMQGRAMVPISFVSESFGATVIWFPSSQRIDIVN
ncbi:MAG: stalk domain-containing protein [Eubacteriales bacterium]